MGANIKKSIMNIRKATGHLMGEVTPDERYTFQRLFKDLDRKTALTQIFLGTVSGWITGFTLMKVGKMMAFAIGGTIVLFQIANENGVVKIDWVKVEKQVDKVTDKVEEVVAGNSKTWTDKISEISRQNMVLFMSFVGGVFLGIGAG